MSAPKFTSKIPTRAVIVCSVALPILGWLLYSNVFDITYRPMDVTGTIQAKEVPVASKVGGRIAKVFVSEGQEVKMGDSLVEFETPELDAKGLQMEANVLHSKAELDELKHGPRQAEIDKARANASQALANWQMLKNGYREEEVSKAHAQSQEAQSNLELLERGYREEEVRNAKALMDQAKVEMDFQKKDWERYQYLSTQGAVRGRDKDEAKSKYDGAQKAYEAAVQTYKKMSMGPRKEEIEAARGRAHSARAQANMYAKGPRHEEVEVARQQYLAEKQALTLLEQGTRQEEIAKAAAQLKQSEASLAELEAQLQEKRVAAPVNAEVSVMDLHAGEVVAAGKSIATLTKLDEVWTRVYLPERELGRVRMGQEVDVRADSYPTRTFHGKIVQIPSVAEFTPRNVQTAEERSAQVFGLKITIDNKDHLLRGGMNADITLPPVEKPFGRLARIENAGRDHP